MGEVEDLQYQISMMQSIHCHLHRHLHLHLHLHLHHHHHFNPSSDGNFISSIWYPKIFGYLIPTLVTAGGVNEQGTTRPLIETHTATLCSFLVATILYCIALAADYKTNSSQFWGLTAITLGSLSAVSLVSTLVPRSIGDKILYIAWIFASIIIVELLVYQYRRLFINACRRFYHENLKPFFCNLSNWFQDNNNISSTEQRRPIV